MARIRSLKIGFFENEELARLCAHIRLLFEGLWLLSDREGRLEDRPLRIKARVFPYEAWLDIDAMLTELHEAGFILRYDADGVSAIQVLQFTRHQRPKNDEAVSLIPAPSSEIPRGKVTGPRISELGRDIGQRDRGQRTEEGECADGAPVADAATPAVVSDGETEQQTTPEQFSDLWNTWTQPPIPRCRELSTKRRRHIRSRLGERETEEWIEVFRRISASTFCRGMNDRGWIATFDWVIGTPDVAVKVLEGKYDDRRKAPRAVRPLEPPPFEPWTCPHTPMCDGRWRCHQRIELDAFRAREAAKA